MRFEVLRVDLRANIFGTGTDMASEKAGSRVVILEGNETGAADVGAVGPKHRQEERQDGHAHDSITTRPDPPLLRNELSLQLLP